MLKNIISLSLLLLLFLLPTTGKAQLSTEKEKEIDELFQEYTDQPGVAAAIYSKGKVIYQKTFGYANLDYDIKVTPQTVFEIGALTMHFTAACVLILENQGKLALDDPIHQYLPNLPNYAQGKPTIRHLLHHTSGIRDHIIGLDMKENTFDVTYDDKDAYNFIKKQQALGFKPGREYEYSNSNYFLLGQIVEKVSGLSLGAYAKQEIFDPLEMTNTFYYDKAGVVIKNRAIGYAKEEGDSVFTQNHFFNYTSVGDGRLQTTLEDFIKWMQNFDESKIGGKDFLHQIIKNGVETDGDLMTYALGLEHGVFAGFNSFGHNGYWGGFNTFFLKFPQPDISIVVFSNNSTMGSPGKVFQISRILLAEKQPKEIIDSLENRPTIPVTIAQLEKWTGDYIAYKTGYLRKILVENDTLIYSVSENSQRKLVPIGKGEFRVLGAPFYSIQFKKDKNGNNSMAFKREGFTLYSYNSYQPSQPTDAFLKKLSGTYYSQDLGVEYVLTIEKDELVVHVKGKEYMRYKPITKNIFGSNSGHHGYFTFSENATVSSFMMNDYSMQKVKFVKL